MVNNMENQENKTNKNNKIQLDSKNKKAQIDGKNKKQVIDRKVKQILAWFAIILIAFLYIASFMLSVLNIPGSQGLFEVALVSTLLVPILIYVYIWLAGVLKGRGQKKMELYETEEKQENQSK